MAVPVRIVQLPAVPIALFRRSDADVQSVLAAAEHAIDQGSEGLTASLALVVRTLIDEYGDISAGIWSEIEVAEAEGRTSIDLQLEAPVTIASAAETWLRLLEHLDDLRAAGQFEHPPTPDDIRSFRRWLVEQIAGQVRTDREPAAFTSA